MHELSLTQSVLDIIDEYAAEKNFSTVKTIKLSFGQISCIDPEALTFAFETLARGRTAEGAALEFDIRPVIIYCFKCGRDMQLDSYQGTCPECGTGEIILAGGTEELQLTELDVE